MKIAVTGASGFVGRHVLNELLRYDVEIIAVTRDANRLAGISPDISVVEMDISSYQAACYASLGRPDSLIHLAWDGLPNYKSLHHFESELPVQFNFLKRLVSDGLRCLLVAGTCFEYGMQSGPLRADMDTLPANPYGYAKDALRRQLQFLQSVKPYNLTWARLFYMFGDGQPAGSLYSLLRAAVSRGDKVFYMSGGEQLRDYLPVEKVAEQIVRYAISGRNLGPVNVCSGQPISVRKLVEHWVRENSWQIALNLGHFEYPDYEPLAFWGGLSTETSINA